MAERLTLGQLEARCRQAENRVPIGSFWRHRENKTVYEITGFGIGRDDEVEAEYRRAARLSYGGLQAITLGDPRCGYAPMVTFHRAVAEFPVFFDQIRRCERFSDDFENTHGD